MPTQRLSHPHIHFCANVVVQRVVVQIQEYNTHSKTLPYTHLLCLRVTCVNALNIKPEHLMLSLNRMFVSVFVLPDKGEGEQIAAL